MAGGKQTKYMRMALDLAGEAVGRTSPNPTVGAVIVAGGKVVGRGYHKAAGKPHAEVEAIRATPKTRLKGATMYVTLEPCCHEGKTPPCTDAILDAGIKEVVIAVADPNPIVGGKGIALLKKKGVVVKTGMLRDEARRMNESYFTFHELGRPFVVVKWAMTLDGRTSTDSGDSKWISNSESREYAHQLRSVVDAIMIGVGTAIEDDPILTCRMKGYKGKQPARIIVDSLCRVPASAKCVADESGVGTIIATCEDVPESRMKALRKKGCELIEFPRKEGQIDIVALLDALAKKGIQSVLVEGGRRLIGSFFEAGIVDKVVCFISTKIVGGTLTTSPIAGQGIESIRNALELVDIEMRTFGDDVCIEGYIKR